MLIAFKDSGNGADFPEIAATRLAGTDPCAANWYGVTCDRSDPGRATPITADAAVFR
jgi:hypothetical protein